MSYDAMRWACELTLPSNEKNVIVQLAYRHNRDTGQCNPSLERIAKDTGLSKSSVCVALKNLANRGILRRSQRFLDGAQTRTDYVLSIGNKPVQAADTPVLDTDSPVRLLDTPVRNTDDPCPPAGRPLSATRTQTRNKNKEIEHTRDAENVYELYPRKVAKGRALKAIERALKSISRDVLMERVGRFAELCRKQGTEAQFIPHPASWFNDLRWEDESVSAPPRKAHVFTSFEDPAYLAHRAEVEARA